MNTEIEKIDITANLAVLREHLPASGVKLLDEVVAKLLAKVKEQEKQESSDMECTLDQMLSKEQQERYGLDEHGHRRNVQHVFMRACVAIADLEAQLKEQGEENERQISLTEKALGLERKQRLAKNSLQAKLDNLQAENAKYKEALGNIVNPGFGDMLLPSDYVNIAAEALKEPNGRE